MRSVLTIDDAKKNSIINYYDNSVVEKMMMIFFKIKDAKYVVQEIIKPNRDEYKYIEKKLSGVKGSFMIKAINVCIKNKYDGMILVHNHREKLIPLLSSTDRMANEKIKNYFKSKSINLLFGSGVYANKKITYLLENKYKIAQSLR